MEYVIFVLMGRRALLIIVTAVASAALFAACSFTNSELDGQVVALDTELDAVTADVATQREQLDQVLALLATPTPMPTVEYREHGFTLPVPEGVEVRTAGIGEANATPQQGQLAVTTGEVSMVLIWTSGELTAAEAVQGAFEVLQASQPDLNFQPVNQGEITVGGETGAFGTFGALDANEAVLGIGLIGGWSCPAGPTFSMTVAGTALATVETLFTSFTENFRCG